MAIALAFPGDGAGRGVLLEYVGPGPSRWHPALRGLDVFQLERALRDSPLLPASPDGSSGEGF